MLLDTRGIPEGRSVIAQESDLESVKENLPRFTDKVTCNITIDRDQSMLMLQVEFTGSFILECARCLNDYPFPVSGTIRLVLIECEGKSGAAPEHDVADYYFNSYEYVVDLSLSLFDEIMLMLPMKPLCRIDCKGILVAADKADKVSGDQECDPRWDALKKLKQKNNT